MRWRTYLPRILGLFCLVFASACSPVERVFYVLCDAGAARDGESERPFDSGEDEMQDPSGEGGATDAEVGTDAGESRSCPPLASRNIVDVPSGVLSDTQLNWTCDNIYVLNGVVIVHSGERLEPQVLRIEAGTVIQGQVTSSGRGFLVVTRTGRIEARGTPEDPIVFTSANPAGERARDDWGGLTLLGAASTGGTRRVEGYPATVNGQNIDAYLAYGPFKDAHADAGQDASVEVEDDAGTDPGDDAGVDAGTVTVEDGGPEASEQSGRSVAAATTSNLFALSSGSLGEIAVDNHDCGTLTFVRVEFASFNAGGSGNESNGIQMYACGHNTSFDHVQVHRSGDDGVEIFGGTVDVRHLLVTGASDDGLDWDDGWRGRAQYVIVQQYPDVADLGFEAGGSIDVSPELAPEARIFNATWIGTTSSGASGIGGRLRGSSRGVLSNQIFLGFSSGAIEVGGASAHQNLQTGALSVRYSVVWPATDGELLLTLHGNREYDPMLKAPFDVTMPDFTPRFQAQLGFSVAETPSEADDDERPPFFDVDARYLGAIEPQGTDWTRGWTAYPEN